VGTSLSALLLAGGFGATVAFCSGLAFATTAARLVALGAVGALLACCFQAGVFANGVDDRLVGELLNAVATANALGWLAGTLLVARVRAIEYLAATAE
jgi:hypothetical protein